MHAFWRGRSAILFFLIAFGLPWAGWTMLAILHPPRGSVLRWLLFMTGWFCSLAGFVATYVDRGWSGPRSFVRRTLHFRLPIVWWLYAFFLYAFGGVISMVIYGSTHGGLGPIKPLMLFSLFAPSSLFWFLTGPLGEEFGWRGFLLPHLLEKYSPLTSAILLGALWELWHLPLYYNMFLHDLRSTVSFTIGIVGLSLLVTILFTHTSQSLSPVIVLHWTANVTMTAVHKIFPGIKTTDAQDPYDMITMAILTVIVVVLFLPSLRRRFQECAGAATS